MGQQSSERVIGQESDIRSVRLTTIVLAIVTALAVYLCWMLVIPFLKPVTWALALAVAAQPLHAWLNSKLRRKTLAAAISVLLIAVILIAPGVPLIQALTHEAVTAIQQLQEGTTLAGWREMTLHHPRLAPALSWVQSKFDLGREAARLATGLTSWVSSLIANSVWALTQLLISFFTLFYVFRDGDKGLAALRSWIPLSEREADLILLRVSDTIYATLYGHLLASITQGSLGGLMFWFLGLPTPLLWGAVMALLAVVPVLGAFVVWIPAAVILLLKGSWIKALILILWGTFVVGLIDNLIYPILVGNRVRLHTVAVFLAIMGGLISFGMSGLILGPLIVAVTAALLNIWRDRMHTVQKG